MKRAILIFTMLTLCRNIMVAQAIITFDKGIQHLGFVRQGDTLHFGYAFTNTGNEPLLISDTKVECGCTVVHKPVQPVLPGKQDIIEVIFYTNGAIGRQDRTVTVLSNASNSQAVVRFKCVVLEAKK